MGFCLGGECDDDGCSYSDPGVGQYVRYVSIQPWVEDVQAKPRPRWLSRLRDRIMAIVNPSSHRRLAEEGTKQRIQKYIQIVTRALDNMGSLREYSIAWDEKTPHWQLFNGLLGSTIAKMGETLNKLTIKVPFRTLASLTPVNHLHRLEELDICFYTGDMEHEEIELVFRAVISFVNSLSGLQSLFVSSTATSSNLDLAQFFDGLGVFPQLRRIGFAIPADGAHLSSSGSFTRFLRNHQKTLHHLGLASTLPASPGVVGDRANLWVSSILTSIDISYTKLRSVDISLQPSTLRLLPIIRLISAQRQSLESFRLSGHFLSYPEVECLLNGQSGLEVERLHLQVQIMSPELWRLLKSALPALKHIEICFDQLQARDPAAYSSREFPHLGFRKRIVCFPRCYRPSSNLY